MVMVIELMNFLNKIKSGFEELKNVFRIRLRTLIMPNVIV